MRHTRPLLAFIAALALASPTPASADEGWVHDSTDQGVEVTTHTDPARTLPVFRGVGMVDAGVFEILAVLDDSTRYTEWMAACVGARIVKRINEFERIQYNRTGAPWPVSDRDVVLHSWVEASLTKREVWARFESVASPDAGPVSGVVRMPRLGGYYHLEGIDLTHTRVTYEVDADPGGMLPKWVVKLATRKLPIETITGLRRQVAKTLGQYEPFLQRYDPQKGGRIPDRFAK